MFGSIFLPIAMFWFGWTSGSSVPWIVPIIGSAFFTVSVFLLFQAGLKYVYSLHHGRLDANGKASCSYLSDCYPRYVASILAGNDFFRSMVGAAFPLFSTGA